MNVRHSLEKKLQLVLQLLLFGLWAAAGVSAAGSFDKGICWKIEGKGAAPSYLFGTMHSEDPQITQLPGAVERAFERANGVTLEVVMDMQSLLAMSAAFMLTDGSTLESHVGPRLYRRTVKAMADHGQAEMVVAMMKPWAVAVTLMMPPSKTGMVLDLMLYQRAVAAGKPVTGLESPDEQMNVFDSMSKQDQLDLLKDALDHQKDMQQMLGALKKAYLSRDLKRMVEISDKSMHDSSSAIKERFSTQLIDERNHRMAERMQSQLLRGNEFIAVGALHLPGDQGLLNLLTERGYRLTRVY